MTTTEITLAEELRRLRTFERSGLHFEAQTYYAADLELYGRWLAGDLTLADVEADAGYVDWYANVRRHVAAGHIVRRVRILDDPPSDYQRFEEWLTVLNVNAGEEARHLSRSGAERLGVLPALTDGWILDETELITVEWSSAGDLERITSTTDPEVVRRALDWYRIAFDAAAPHASSADPAPSRPDAT